MKRSSFLKTLAISAITPTIITEQKKGVSVEVKSISLLPDTEFMTPEEVLNIYKQTGNIIYRSIEK